MHSSVPGHLLPGLRGLYYYRPAIYVHGWFILRRRAAGRWQSTHLAAFMGGLAAIFLALASPIEPFASLLLQVHMVQHLLLTMVAPPFLWLGLPLIPVLRGLPEPVRTYWVAPLMRSQTIRSWFRRTDASVIGTAAFHRRHLALARAGFL